MSHAQLAANWYATVGSSPAHAGIYVDGVIIYLCVSEDTQARILLTLGGEVIDLARSEDGFCGVLIVRPDRWMHCLDLIAKAVELTVTDNRDNDANTIELFASEYLQKH